MVLYVSVGESAVCPVISPYGTSPQLDQSLESVADAECKTVPLVKQFFYRFFDLRVLECGREELGRSRPARLRH